MVGLAFGSTHPTRPVSRGRARLNDVAASTLVIEDDGLVIEQEASHDGDLRQRPTEPACQSGPDPDDPGKKAADVSREQYRKLSVNERLEPDSMPGRLEQLEKSRCGIGTLRWADGRSTARVVPGSPAARSAWAALSATWPLSALARPGRWRVASGEWRVNRGRCLLALARPGRECRLTRLAR